MARALRRLRPSAEANTDSSKDVELSRHQTACPRYLDAPRLRIDAAHVRSGAECAWRS